MKRIVTWVLVGFLLMPFAFITFAYAYGLMFRPDDMSIQEAFQLITNGTFNVNAFLEKILPLWMPIGGILGAIGALVFNRKKSENA